MHERELVHADNDNEMCSPAMRWRPEWEREFFQKMLAGDSPDSVFGVCVSPSGSRSMSTGKFDCLHRADYN
jgi:hypothetical protein